MQPLRGTTKELHMNTFSRLSLLKAAGLATGAAAVTASPALSAAMPAVETAPSAPLPSEPVVAIVRDARLGEVTVLSGKTEKTYRDKALAQRLLKAAGQNHHGKQGVA
jgi:hypothetical protein